MYIVTDCSYALAGFLVSTLFGVSRPILAIFHIAFLSGYNYTCACSASTLDLSCCMVLFFYPPQLIIQGSVVSLQDANNANNGNGLVLDDHNTL